MLAGLVVGWFTWHRASPSGMPQSLAAPQRLTTNPTENPISASAMSPDGKYLAYSDKTGTYLRVMSTGETHSLLSSNTDVQFLGWYPDSTQLLAAWSSSASTRMGLWVLSILGGNPRQISDEGWSASVSPDGSQIAFLKSASLGDQARKSG
jgi:Tol biopolymer transport system component